MKLTKGQRFGVGLNYVVAAIWAVTAVLWIVAGWRWFALVPVLAAAGFIYAARMWTKTYRSINESNERIRQSAERLNRAWGGLS